MVLQVFHEGLVILSEERHLIIAAEILDHGLGVRFTGLGSLGLHTVDETCHADFHLLLPALALRHQVIQVRQLAIRESIELELISLQRMVGQIHAHHFLLFLENLQDIRLHRHHRRLRLLHLQLRCITEQ